MNQAQYFNKARDMFKQGYQWYDFLDCYPPSCIKNDVVSPLRIGRVLTKISNQSISAYVIALYIVTSF